MRVPSLSSDEKTDVCFAARAAWDKRKPCQQMANFVWQDWQLIATHSTFQLFVHTERDTSRMSLRNDSKLRRCVVAISSLPVDS
jgi:hypothetical protein